MGVETGRGKAKNEASKMHLGNGELLTDGENESLGKVNVGKRIRWAESCCPSLIVRATELWTVCGQS